LKKKEEKKGPSVPIRMFEQRRAFDEERKGSKENNTYMNGFGACVQG
jgi:hypothetical protein